MTLAAATELVRNHDPDRFGAAIVAPSENRAAIITLYALNIEFARAPFQSSEPMLAEMRLQWWIDRLDQMGNGVSPPLHDILSPFWQEWGTQAGSFVSLAEARRRDCAREPFETPGEVMDYIRDTSGQLMSIAAKRLGATSAAEGVIADQALGAGLAAWLRVLPQLQAIGLGLKNAAPDDSRILAVAAKLALSRATKGRKVLPKQAAAALYPGPRIGSLLDGIADGRFNPFVQVTDVTPFQRRASLARLALTGRWWR